MLAVGTVFCGSLADYGTGHVAGLRRCRGYSQAFMLQGVMHCPANVNIGRLTVFATQDITDELITTYRVYVLQFGIQGK
jgi:hypothetical protein